jgi:UDP-N-acetyl-D-mannosaminuronic acid dehydrogenase
LTVLREHAQSVQEPKMTDDLLEKIADRSAKVCVVGLGYVGLTLACVLARSGFRVTGIDTDAVRVAHVVHGRYPFGGAEPELPAVLACLVQNRQLTATHAFTVCSDADIILVAVQTPVDQRTKRPALEALCSAISSIGAHVRSQALVVVESTMSPGTMRDRVVPLLERASHLSATTDFYVGCCPERVMPGRLLSNLARCSRVMGGWTPRAGQAGAALYRTITCGDVDVTDCLTAELVKTAENAYRDVQIAFANEVALVCEDYGADVYIVRELVNKAPHRDMHLPGAGVGGHCIPKDPWLLVANTGPSTPLRLIPAARAVNDSMPIHVGELVEVALHEWRRKLSDSRVVVLGYAYLENSDDTRNSPSAELVAWLQARGAHVTIHDPLVPGLQLDLAAASTDADALVVMVAHDCFRDLQLDVLGRLMRTRVLIDGRRLFSQATARAAGFSYRRVGIGS